MSGIQLSMHKHPASMQGGHSPHQLLQPSGKPLMESPPGSLSAYLQQHGKAPLEVMRMP